ncbi:MAG: Hydrolase, alpha/beta fold family [Labilithrix sp.]|nr:Hydrolase, alpha/beta fold family [Labilithrix sp.]
MKTFHALLFLTLTIAGCGGQELADEEADDPESLGSATQAFGRHDRDPEIHRVALSTGVTLSYLEQGSRRGDPVIFLHGYTDSHRSFDLNLPYLSRRHHVYALDQRGHGDSSKPACCYAQSDFANDVVAFMNELHIRKATLVGHSMGALIAHKVASESPSRVDRLVLIGAGPTLAGNPVALDFKPAVDSLVDPVDLTFIREFQASTFYRPIPPSFLDTAVAESSKVPATVWQQAFDGLLAEDHTAQLSNIRAKTLIFWGDQDIFFGAADEQTLDTEIRRSKLRTYEQTGHGLHVERPGAFVHDLEEFLD